MLEARELVVRLAGEARSLLDGVSLGVEAGEVVAVLGRSGVGKTTLIHVLAGLVPWLRAARVGGEISLHGEPIADLDPGQRAHLLSTCLDRPDAQLFLHTPRQELAAAERLYGDQGLSARAADELGLAPLLDRRITELSSGERQRVALAVALAGSPRPVLLDEPCAHLDSDGAEVLSRLLEELRRLGGAILLAEQAGWRLAGGVSRWLALDRCRVEPCQAPRPPVLPAPASPPQERLLLRAAGLEVGIGSRRLLRGVNLEVHVGEIVLVTGANGSGKSTLGRVLAGLQRPSSGRVDHLGERVALMLPDPELQLFAPSVAEELGSLGGTREEVARVLRRHRLEHTAARAPWSLSRGERQRLVHAALDLLRPAVMIVDEPGQGLDPSDLERLVELIARRAAKGRGYVVFSHREELVQVAHRHFRILGGELVPAEDGSRR